jgi:hypothetical protein
LAEIGGAASFELLSDWASITFGPLSQEKNKKDTITIAKKALKLFILLNFLLKGIEYSIRQENTA